MAQISSIFVFFLFICFTHDLILGAVLPPDVGKVLPGHPKHFTYIGSHSPRIQRSSQSIISHYFLSQNAAGYEFAASDCKAFLGDDATLLFIETQEELQNLKIFLQNSDDIGSTYWIGARYDPTKDTFLWDDGLEIGSWAPWDQGYPNTRTPLTRVYAKTVRDIQFRTQFNTVSTRFICELKTGEAETEAEPCYDDNDLVIVINSSENPPDNSAVILEFTSNLAIAWADNPRNRIALITSSIDFQQIFGLNDNLTVEEIREKIYSASHFDGSVSTYLGLDMAAEEFQLNPRNDPKNILFLTDNKSKDITKVMASAKNIQDAGIRSFVIGIGTEISENELFIIAGNDPDYVLITDEFDNLLDLLKPVSRKVCNI